MSTCSTNSRQQHIGAPPSACEQAPAPMACDTSSSAGLPAPAAAAAAAALVPSASATSAAAAAAAAAADVNGQHHLLRHVLSPEQCSDALRHFNTTESKTAARMVNRMSQRELRTMFEKVYNVTTNSNNNTWLRRKLLEAVGASRRFYAAANRTNRPKPRRVAPASSDGQAAERKPRSRSPRAAAVAAAAPGEGHATAAQHHISACGPALPAGSPRALTRMRRGSGLSTGGSSGGSSGAMLDLHVPRHHYLHPQPGFPAAAQQLSSEGEDTAQCSEGSEGHPRALARHSQHASPAEPGSPTSAFAAAAAFQAAVQYSQYQPFPQYQPLPSSGSNSSLYSSQFAAPPACAAPQRLPSLGLGLGLGSFGLGGFGATPQSATPAAPASEPKLARSGSLAALASLLNGSSGGAPAAAAAEPMAVCCPQSAAQQQLAALPSTDLGMGLWVPTDASLAAAGPLAPKPSGPVDEWLLWDDCQLPSLF